MQKLSILFALCIVSILGCDNNLEVTAPWKDIPIVYGILSPQDTMHYIRIEKAFLDPNISAKEIARIPDSLYYKNLDAAIIDVISGQRYQLTEIDAALAGFPRDTGVFAEVPNFVYGISADELVLKSANTYRLEINRSDQLPLVFAETEVVTRSKITRPVAVSKLRFEYDNNFTVTWREEDNAYFYDVSLVINYDEGKLDDPGSYEEYQLEWPIGRGIEADQALVPGINFYQYLSDQLIADPSIGRFLNGIDVYVRSGGEELFELSRIQNANSGITSVGGDIPEYTNISEGVGILSTSNRAVVADLPLNPVTLDSLINGYITKDLNFR